MIVILMGLRALRCLTTFEIWFLLHSFNWRSKARLKYQSVELQRPCSGDALLPGVQLALVVKQHWQVYLQVGRA